MDQQKRLDILEARMEKIEKFLTTVELWLTVLSEQFKLTRNFVLSLEKKPETAPQQAAAPVVVEEATLVVVGEPSLPKDPA